MPDGMYAPSRGAGHDLASRQQTSPESAQQQEEQAELERRYSEACPMHVSGTEVTAQTVPNGAALVFTTTQDVNQLREQVDRFADAHNELAEHMSAKGEGAPPSSSMGGMDAEAQGAHSMYGEQRSIDAAENMEEGHAGAGSTGVETSTPSSFVPSRAEVQEIDGGAEIVLTPRDPSELQALRQNVEQQARQMASGACPLMEPQAAGGGNELRIGG
jgi:hypothetical protein